MLLKVNNLRLCINPIISNLFNGHKGFVHYICSSANDKGIHVEHEILEFPELLRSDDDKDKISSIIAEYHTAKRFGKQVPSHLVCDHVAELMTLPNKTQRLKYLTFLYKKELLKNAQLRKKVRKAENRKVRAKVETEHIKYGPGFNTLLPFIQQTDIKKLYKRRAASSLLFGQNIVIDLDYDDYMAKWEAKNCVYQLCQVLKSNVTHLDPFSIYFCNADRSKATVHYLEQSLTDLWSDSLITCSSSSYLDIFPKEKLVYLSPHSPEVMESYDHDAIYIIGGFVDKRIQKPLSYEKTQREGIRSCRLPLDEEVRWKCGSKSLTLDQMVNILLEMKISNDWKRALQFLPSRKIKQHIEKND